MRVITLKLVQFVSSSTAQNCSSIVHLTNAGVASEEQFSFWWTDDITAVFTDELCSVISVDNDKMLTRHSE